MSQLIMIVATIDRDGDTASGATDWQHLLQPATTRSGITQKSISLIFKHRDVIFWYNEYNNLCNKQK